MICLQFAVPAASQDAASPESLYNRALLLTLQTKPDYTQAADLFRQAAERGLPRAQRALGELYREGVGVPRDPAEAAKWLRKAADKDDARAQSSLAALYASGQGVPQSDKEAVKWFKKAANGGDKSGQLALGVLYANGRGVSKDALEAVKWYRAAAEQGDALAQFALGSVYERGLGKVRPDPAESVVWYTKALQQGFEGARAPLAAMRQLHVLTEQEGRSRLVGEFQIPDVPLARAAKVNADVSLQLQVNREGRITRIDVLAGHPLLNASVVEAMQAKTFTPYVVEGEAVPFSTSITIRYAY
jgi:TonB family protein